MKYKTPLISPRIWIYVMFILIYLHKIVLRILEKNKTVTVKDNLKVHLMVGFSSIKNFFGDIL